MRSHCPLLLNPKNINMLLNFKKIEAPKYNLTIERGPGLGVITLQSIDGIHHGLKILRGCPSLICVNDKSAFISVQTFPQGTVILVEGEKECRALPYTLERIKETRLNKIINKF